MNQSVLLISALIVSLLLSNAPLMIIAQINSPCSPTMLSSVTRSGCMNFLTGSGGTSPTSECCGALKSLTGIGMDCLCLIVTASVPINLPINRTLAISLPRACAISALPVRCKASAAPLPAPGPTPLSPTTSPTDSQIPEGPPPSLGPTTSPTTSQYPDEDQDFPDTKNRGDPTRSTPPLASASLPSSSHSLKLWLLLFAFASSFRFRL